MALIVLCSIWAIHRYLKVIQVLKVILETPEQLVYLRLAGCDQVQGYHFSRPLQAEQIAEFERRFRSRTRLTA